LSNADLCIGNPPFVRNQDLPEGWSEKVAAELRERSGVALSGLANAWQYFFLLSLLSTADDGICALVIPFEWVSRPSAAKIRDFIARHGWSVDVYRLPDEVFDSVLTTASVTVVDKRDHSGRWRFFDKRGDGEIVELLSTTGSAVGHVEYMSRTARRGRPRAMRGLSPGTQKVFTLTEAERARLGLAVGRDVVPCVTSLRLLGADACELDRPTFEAAFRFAGQNVG
tara:strand:+ start:1069 stop:1746 length:678 start_codon:yes stop_codon:yes gene_type:complete